MSNVAQGSSSSTLPAAVNKSPAAPPPPSPGPEELELEVKAKDMCEENIAIVKDIVKNALTTCVEELTSAQTIKENLDEKLGPKWHCIVGRHFASHVSYEPKSYLYVKVGREVILVFRSGSNHTRENVLA